MIEKNIHFGVIRFAKNIPVQIVLGKESMKAFQQMLN
jgi:hypothetical protein